MLFIPLPFDSLFFSRAFCVYVVWVLFCLIHGYPFRRTVKTEVNNVYI